MTWDSLGYEYINTANKKVVIGGTRRGWNAMRRDRLISEAIRAGVNIVIPKRPTEEQLERCRQEIRKGYYERQQQQLKNQAGL